MISSHDSLLKIKTNFFTFLTMKMPIVSVKCFFVLIDRAMKEYYLRWANYCSFRLSYIFLLLFIRVRHPISSMVVAFEFSLNSRSLHTGRGLSSPCPQLTVTNANARERTRKTRGRTQGLMTGIHLGRAACLTDRRTPNPPKLQVMSGRCKASRNDATLSHLGHCILDASQSGFRFQTKAHQTWKQNGGITYFHIAAIQEKLRFRFNLICTHSSIYVTRTAFFELINFIKSALTLKNARLLSPAYAILYALYLYAQGLFPTQQRIK